MKLTSWAEGTNKEKEKGKGDSPRTFHHRSPRKNVSSTFWDIRFSPSGSVGNF
jgi:hypothetical protein